MKQECNGVNSLDQIMELARKADAERIARMQSNPNNGRFGWWRVDGIRHEATVLASSAMDACEKAKDVVESWEFPEAFWVGEELPEVIAV